MNTAKALLTSLIKRVIDTDAINAEIQRQSDAWLLSDLDGKV